jgi:hypothetical protein
LPLRDVERIGNGLGGVVGVVKGCDLFVVHGLFSS